MNATFHPFTSSLYVSRACSTSTCEGVELIKTIYVSSRLLSSCLSVHVYLCLSFLTFHPAIQFQRNLTEKQSFQREDVPVCFVIRSRQILETDTVNASQRLPSVFGSFSYA